MTSDSQGNDPVQHTLPRRGLLSVALMAVGLVAGYGLGALHFFRYLVPLGNRNKKREMFVGTLGTIPVGGSLTVRDPKGEKITIARTSEDRENPAAGFQALSEKCPHLGCKVHFDSGSQQFICPCHMGIFDKDGIAVSGPPAKENKNLFTYEVKVNPDSGCVFVMVSAEGEHGA